MKRYVKLSCLFIARLLGLFAFSRFLTRSQLRILCYHGGCMADESGFNPKLFLKTETLRSRMRWLEDAGFSVVSLDDAMSVPAVRGNKTRVTVTFDDGWYSTGAKLLPVMAEMKMPSTLYLCTKHFQEAWPVLPVAVRYIFWKSTRRQVEISGFDAQLDGLHTLENRGQRDRLAGKIVASVEKSVTNKAEVVNALDRLANDLGVKPLAREFLDTAFSYMTADELRVASASGCAIELHGHVHQYPRGDPERFKTDLTQCLAVIDEMGLRKPRHYCYPSGVFDDGAPAVLQELGVVSATTCVNRLTSEADLAKRYYLPRFLDGENVHMLEFQAELSGFAGVLRACLGVSRQ